MFGSQAVGRSVLAPGTMEGHASDTSVEQSSFAGLLGRALEQISAQEKQADRLTSLLAAGQPVDLHDVVIATEKAQLTLELAVQVRNKVVEAYQETMRMPV
ncbi:MAG TPA: flagellar hook-basal body complex protein FliE [Firmicutes bacterium]|nr:flagellar hook-basal body complex protein FliE [Bacillota bacterium]